MLHSRRVLIKSSSVPDSGSAPSGPMGSLAQVLSTWAERETEAWGGCPRVRHLKARSGAELAPSFRVLPQGSAHGSGGPRGRSDPVGPRLVEGWVWGGGACLGPGGPASPQRMRAHTHTHVRAHAHTAEGGTGFD